MQCDHIEDEKSSQALAAKNCLSSVKSHLIERVQVMITSLLLLQHLSSAVATSNIGGMFNLAIEGRERIGCVLVDLFVLLDSCIASFLQISELK